jgi:hypothetical protein
MRRDVRVAFAERWRGSLAHRVGGIQVLQDALGCDGEGAVRRAGLCRAPRPGEDLVAWAELVAAYANVDRQRLLALAQRIRGGRVAWADIRQSHHRRAPARGTIPWRAFCLHRVCQLMAQAWC